MDVLVFLVLKYLKILRNRDCVQLEYPMNTELYSLMWYTRADIIRMKTRNNTVHRKEHSNWESVDSVADYMNDEVSTILTGIARTLHDTIASGKLLGNTLFIAHVIQAFTVHLFTLKSCREAYEKLGVSILSLDNNYVRVCCHIDTIVHVCKANLAILCTSSTDSNRRRIALKPTSFSGISVGVVKRASSDPIIIPQSAKIDSSKSDTSKLIDNLDQPVYNPAMNDLLIQHGRLSRNLSSKSLIDAHKAAHSAMSELLSGVPAKQAV
jgi:hypothetical protein